MNILDAVHDLQTAAEEVLDTTRRRTAALKHVEMCLKIAAGMREQVPASYRPRYDEHIAQIAETLRRIY